MARAGTYRTFLTILTVISNIISFMTVAAAADTVTASVANLGVLTRRRACAVSLLAVTCFSTPSRLAIADTAFALAPSAADL